jgi:predicted Zn-dependent protease
VILRRTLAFSCAAWLLAASAAQAADPHPMLPPGYSPEMSSDEAGLWMQVDKAEATIKTSANLVRDEKLNAYVSGVICKLAGDYCASTRVYIVDTPLWNASCYPNGMVVVNTGLLLQVKNEAQFAFILGHELTHYLHRHTVEEMRKRVNTAGFLAVFGIAVAGVGVGVGANTSGISSLANTMGAMSLMSFSRDEERDADDGGFKLATALHYAPDEAPAIWLAEVETEKADPNFGRSLFGSTHPASEERAATLSRMAAQAKSSGSDWMTNEDAFQAATAPFIHRWIEEELSLGQPDRSITIFRRLAASKPSEGIYQYGLGEAYRKRNQKNDLAAAENAYRGALATANPPAEAWRGLGLMAMKAGNNAEAKDAFTQYRVKLPDASDKAMIDFYLTQL